MPGGMPEPIGRRRFIGYVLAAPTLVTAADLGASTAATAATAAPAPELSEIVDLNDLMTLAALPTSGLITVEVNPDGTGLMWALDQALSALKDRAAWEQLVRNGMEKDFSWDRSAEAYVEVFRRAMAKV